MSSRIAWCSRDSTDSHKLSKDGLRPGMSDIPAIVQRSTIVARESARARKLVASGKLAQRACAMMIRARIGCACSNPSAGERARVVEEKALSANK